MAADKPAAKKAATKKVAPKRKPEPEPEDNTVRFTVDGESWEIDPSSLTIGEVEELEVYFDESYRFVDLNSARGILFMYYLARRRSEPEYTLAGARTVDWKTLRDSDDAERPTEQADADSGDPS